MRSQFENLAATNANQLGDIEARLAARFDGVETLLGDRFAYLDERIGGLEERIEAIDERINLLGAQMERLIVLVEQLVQSR